MVLILTLLLATTAAFQQPRHIPRVKLLCAKDVRSDDLLLSELDKPNPDESSLGSLVEALVVEGGNNNIPTKEGGSFDELIGLYEVSFVRTLKDGENPVGGAWTRKRGLMGRFITQRRSFQHILGKNETGYSTGDFSAVGEVVNVVSLASLWGWIRATVILRGDIVKLTSQERAQDRYRNLTQRAVRAVFDSPRITFGKVGRFVNLSVGPKTSLVIDTPFVNNRVRIGVGARSGTRFLFRRCAIDDAEANEFRFILDRKPTSTRKLCAGLGSLAVGGAVGAVRGARTTGIALSLISTFAAAIVASSGGGIEAGDKSVAESKALISEKQVSPTS